MPEFGHLQFSDVRAFPGMLWLCFPQRLILSSDHRLFPLGILDTVTPLHEVSTMGMNFMYTGCHRNVLGTARCWAQLMSYRIVTVRLETSGLLVF